MAKWTMHSYWLVIERAGHLGLTLPEARQFYRDLRDELHRPVYGVDVDRHPRLAAELARQIFGEVVEPVAEEAVALVEPEREEYEYEPEPGFDEWEITAETEGGEYVEE